MPASTPVYGITYPCSGENINADAFLTFANTMQTALTTAAAEVESVTSRPNAQINAVSNFSITVNTDTTLTFVSEMYDNDGLADLAVNNDRLTIQTPGVYLFNAFADLTGGFATLTSFSLIATVNAVEQFRYKTRKIATSVGVEAMISAPIDCFTGDVVRVLARWTGTGGPATIQTRLLAVSFLTGH